MKQKTPIILAVIKQSDKEYPKMIYMKELLQ